MSVNQHFWPYSKGLLLDPALQIRLDEQIGEESTLHAMVTLPGFSSTETVG